MEKLISQGVFTSGRPKPGCSRAAAATRVLVVALFLAMIVPAGATAGLGRFQSQTQDSAVVGSEELSDLIMRGSLARQRLLDEIHDLHRFVGETGFVVTAGELQSFLSERGSPMSAFAPEIVSASNRYEVDPRLIVAIAGVESNFGRVCKGFNAWGWNNGRTRWQSWAQSIDAYTRSISEQYPNWRDVPHMARTYNPNTPRAWSRKVIAFMNAVGVA